MFAAAIERAALSLAPPSERATRRVVSERAAAQCLLMFLLCCRLSLEQKEINPVVCLSVWLATWFCHNIVQKTNAGAFVRSCVHVHNIHIYVHLHFVLLTKGQGTLIM